jgi:glycogen synthase
MRRLHVLAVASEIFPLVKTGGLADVVGALPPALARVNIATRTLVPGYPAVHEKLTDVTVAHSFAQLHGGTAQTCSGQRAGLDLFVLDAPHLYARPGKSLRRARRARVARQRRALCRAGRRRQPRSRAAQSRAMRRTSCTATTGRRGLVPRCCTIADRRDRRR